MSSFLAESEAAGFCKGFIYWTTGFEKRSLLTNTNFYLLRLEDLFADTASAGSIGVS